MSSMTLKSHLSVISVSLSASQFVAVAAVNLLYSILIQESFVL